MEELNKHWKNCYITSRDSNDYIRQWTASRTSNTTIEIAPFVKFPHLFYININVTHYQWCGPMLLIAEYLGKLTNTRITLNQFLPNLGAVIQRMVTSSLSIVLSSMTTARYYEFVVENNMDQHVKLSSYIEFTDNSKVLAHTKKGNIILIKNGMKNLP